MMNLTRSVDSYSFFGNITYLLILIDIMNMTSVSLND